MKAQDFKPGSICGYNDLELRAASSYEVTRAQLIADIRMDSIFGELEEDVERSEQLRHYAGRIAEAFCVVYGEEEGKDEDYDATTTMHFSLQLGVSMAQLLVRPDTWGMDYKEAGDVLADSRYEFFDYMVVSTNRYMLHRPTLDVLTSNALELILSETAPAEMAPILLPRMEMATQLSLMHSEQFLLDLHLEEEFSAFEAQFSD